MKQNGNLLPLLGPRAINTSTSVKQIMLLINKGGLIIRARGGRGTSRGKILVINIFYANLKVFL